MQTDDHSQSRDWSLEVAAQVISNALGASLDKFLKKKAGFKKQLHHFSAHDFYPGNEHIRLAFCFFKLKTSGSQWVSQ